MGEKIRDIFRQVYITYSLEGITDEAMDRVVDIFLTSERISFVFAEKHFMSLIVGGLITPFLRHSSSETKLGPAIGIGI